MAEREGRSSGSGKRSKFRDRVRSNTQEQKESKSSYGHLRLPNGVHIYKPKGGTRVRLDFLPYTVTDERHPDRNDETGAAVVGELWYRRPYKVHRNVGQESDTVVCLSSVGKKCPICEYRAERMRDGADRKETDGMRPTRRSLYAVVPLGEKEYEEQPHIFDMSEFLFQELLNEELEEDERHADFPDPETGYTLKVRFDEESFAGNKYAQASRIDFLERERGYTEKELRKVPNLDEVLQVLPAREIEKLFMDLDDDDMADNDKGEEPAERGTRRYASSKDEDDDKKDDKRSSRGRDRDEDKDERERDDDRRGARTSRSKDDDEDEDEPDKGERPVRRTARDEDDDSDKDDDRKEKESAKPMRRNPPKRDEDEDDDGDKKGKDDDKPARRSRSSSDDECPSGYKFGVDTDKHKECDDCPLWEKCIDAKDAAWAGKK